jgi:sec-independent protein translocase protein TatA
MPFGIGPLELIIVLVIVLVIFGPKRLPGLGRSLGSGMREFKDSIAGKESDAKPDDAKPDDRAAEPEGIEPSAKPAAAKDAKADAVEEPVPGERRS